MFTLVQVALAYMEEKWRSWGSVPISDKCSLEPEKWDDTAIRRWQHCTVSLKTTLKATPLVGPLISKLRAPKFVESSAAYWETRYSSGGNSGAGSYNQLARFKADYLNDFVERNGIDSVIEFGSGDGAQLQLAKYPQYIGIDVSPTVINVCRQLFADRPEFVFLHAHEDDGSAKADLALSLDVIYHLVENVVFERYMHRLFDAARKSVIIYSSDEDRPEAAHVRHRKFTRWVEANRADFHLAEVVPNRYPYDPLDPANTSFANFFVYRK